MATTSMVLAGSEGCRIPATTRAVAMNRTTTMRTGITVHASSTWLLPYTCGGSRPSSSALFRYFRTAYTSSVKTATNIAAVTPRTNNESPKIECAGVETGAKMLVGLNAGWDASAKAAFAGQTRTG